MRKLTFALNGAFFTYCRIAITILFITAISQSIWSQCTPQNNSISGLVFEDVVQNGIYENTDAGLSNVLITVYDNEGNVVASTVSDVNGNYIFENLPNGNYYRLVFTGSGSFLGLDIYGYFQRPYGFLIGAAFSGVIGVGFYPLMSLTSLLRFVISRTG